VETLWRAEPYRIADGALLPFGDNAERVAHVAADQVLEEAVAVKAAAVLPDLHDPAPDSFRGSIDVDGVRNHGGGIRRKGVPGEYGDAVQVRGAPMQMPRPNDVEIA